MSISYGYLTEEEARSYIGRNDAKDPALLEDIVTTCSREVDRICGRHFYQQAATARTFDSDDGYCIQFGPFNDLVSITSLKYDDNDDGTYEVTVSASDYQLLSIGGNKPRAFPVAWPYEQVRLLNTTTFPTLPVSGRRGLVEVTGTWGWSAVPPEVKSATRLLVAELAKTQDAPLGIAGMGDMGVAYLGQGIGKAVRRLLSDYVHPLNVGLA